MASAVKLKWYLNRLASMSIPEILYRIHEALKRRRDRNRRDYFFLPLTDSQPIALIPGLREALTAWDVPLELIREWEEQLTQAQTGRFFMLGRQWPECTPEQKWHLDPVTGSYWPKAQYCFSIDFRHAPDKGDVKYLWELNRLQYLQPIAALAFIRNDARLKAYCLSEIESWIDGNPPLLGVAWASGIELGLRVVSMLVVLTLTGDVASGATHAKIRSTLAAHARWLARYPSRYSSANNHMTAEGLGLFLIGSLCPEIKGAEAWKVEGLKQLCDTARLQILDDGVGAEQAISYTAVVLEMLLLGLHIAKATHTALPDYYRERITRGGEYLRWLTDAAGNQPRIGDDDNARVLGAYRRDERYVNSVLAAIAAVTGRADLTPPRAQPHLRQALFGFPPAATSTPMGLRTFEQGGYSVARHQVDGREVMLALDHGPLGFLSIAAHGHADALALWLHIGNQPIFVDAGTYLYHSGGEWRRHFRSTGAHNTLTLESADSSTMSGAFNWSHKAQSRIVARELADTHWQLEMEHDGYRKKFGALHRRLVSMTLPQGFTVADSLTGNKSHPVEIGFLLHPDLQARENGNSIDILHGTRPLLRLAHQGPLKTRIVDKDQEDCGWHSPTFGEKQPATRIVFSGTLAPDEQALTRFAFLG